MKKINDYFIEHQQKKNYHRYIFSKYLDGKLKRIVVFDVQHPYSEDYMGYVKVHNFLNKINHNEVSRAFKVLQDNFLGLQETPF